jgi:hypothetical protein
MLAMSMTGYLRRITPEQLHSVRQKPASIRTLLRGPYDMKAMIRDQLRGKLSPQRLAMEAAYARALEIKDQIKQPGNVPGASANENRQKIMRPLQEAGAFGEDRDVLNLQKSWHTLHYLMTGSALPVDSPVGRAILGGQELGPDLGYGPGRILTPEQVREVAESLNQLAKEDLVRRSNLSSMVAAEIYACRDSGDLDLAQEYLPQLQLFYDEAASAGYAMLLYIK